MYSSEWIINKDLPPCVANRLFPFSQKTVSLSFQTEQKDAILRFCDVIEQRSKEVGYGQAIQEIKEKLK
jgi:hypothetical protein